MSWDIFVQDLPEGITSVNQISSDFEPKPIGAREEILKQIQSVFPNVRWFDAKCLNVDQPDCLLDIGIGEEDPCMGFSFFVYGGKETPRLIGELLHRLNLRALDTWAESGLFDAATAGRSLNKHQDYRDQINRTTNE